MADVKDEFVDPFADGYDAQKAGLKFKDNPYMFAGYNGTVHRSQTFRSDANREAAAQAAAASRSLWNDGMLTAIEDRFDTKNVVLKPFKGD